MSGEDRRKAQGGARASPAAETSRKRCSRRGTGVVKATGSYEGYLLMEGILDHHEASSFTRGAHGWSRHSLASSDP